MRKKPLSALVAFSMFSNLALCTASAHSVSNENSELAVVSRPATSQIKKVGKKTKSRKSTSGDVGRAGRTFMALSYYGAIIYSVVKLLSDVEYIDRSKFSRNYEKVKDLTKTLMDPKSGKMARTKSILRNNDAIEAAYGFVSRVTPMYTAGKVIGKLGSAVLGVPDAAGIASIGTAVYISLTATGKSLKDSVVKPGLRLAADVLPDD